jgi:hypothetical protein
MMQPRPLPLSPVDHFGILLELKFSQLGVCLLGYCVYVKTDKRRRYVKSFSNNIDGANGLHTSICRLYSLHSFTTF